MTTYKKTLNSGQTLNVFDNTIEDFRVALMGTKWQAKNGQIFEVVHVYVNEWEGSKCVKLHDGSWARITCLFGSQNTQLL